ncbi:hypothetical protein AGDE_17095 [Angomonas deanei]|uniref:Uncharacterized protein n=1 Tax=Angomonas deanei TaxID=59799 RepID=A0A7G2CP65_9TRYP|nr:hypothetical protein AGDE_17095 [Angomonas deanei]CAD2221646.1 hypothetical protein, conserved [Angomonas deanei]|eukprot:EPY15493.1 hypothetical protein AGDE_17095 [Angomonas deanei]
MQCNNVLYEKALRQDMYFGDELARFNNPLRAAQNNKNNNNNANADGTTNANQRQGGENNPLLNNDGSIVVSSSPSYFTGTSFSTAGNALPSGAASGEAGGNRPNHQGSTQRPQNYNNNVFYFDEHPYSNLNNMNSRSFHFKHLLRRLFCFRCDIARQTELLYLEADHNQRMPPHVDACECLFSGCSYSNESKLIDAVYAEDSEEEEEARVLLGNNSTPNTGNTTAYPGATPQIPGRPPTLRPEALEEANNANNNPTGAPPHLYVNDNDSLFSHDEDENLPLPRPPLPCLQPCPGLAALLWEE